MPRLEKITPLHTDQLESLGFSWHTDSDAQSYIADELLQITVEEADAYLEAANTLYAMYEEAAGHVIANARYHELDIPRNMTALIEQSWQTQRKSHLYSRFDLAGGIDGRPIKLIEFNADTPTMLVETSIIQWMLLQHNNMGDARQFNALYPAIISKIRKMLHHLGQEHARFLFSSVEALREEEMTTQLLQKMAADAGAITSFSHLHEVRFDSRCVYDRWDHCFDAWFKLFPWEDISLEHPDLLHLLEQNSTTCSVVNPAYTLLYQSKGMMKILYELFPDSPYLLETSDRPLECKYVEKTMFGREGANIRIIDPERGYCFGTNGPYEHYKAICQAYVDFPRDTAGYCYQAGVFYSDGACGLGFRRGSEILDNLSRFVGHRIIDRD